MSKYVAYEWDEHELRIVGGSPHAAGLKIDSMQIIPLHSGEEESSHEDVPPSLAAALSKAGVGKADALAVINRRMVELKQMSLPPAPDEEIPTLVRFQAMREFAKLSEDWPLDYLPLSKPPVAEGHDEHEEFLPVLAAAISPEFMASVKDASSEAGLHLSRMVLRPCGSASLFLRRPESAEHRLVVLIDIEANEADITVLHGRDPVLLRTARLPHDVLAEGASAGSVLGEVRRTLPAAHNLVRGERVSAIFISGASEGHQRLAENIQTALEIPCTAFDPFTQVEVGRKAKADVANPSVFAPLLGALLDEVQEVQHSFDFLNPRRPPAPPSQRNRYLIYGGVAAAVLLVPLALWWMTVSKYESQAEEFVKKTEALELDEDEIKAITPVYNTLHKWDSGRIDLLKELDHLSRRLGPTEAKVNVLTFTSIDDGVRIDITGNAAKSVTDGSQNSANHLYRKLTDDWHRVTPGNISKGNNPRYPVDFDLDVHVTKDFDAELSNLPGADEMGEDATETEDTTDTKDATDAVQ